ncbi:MAG: hypothetical protein QOI36_5357 [Pseudonocardiales bacterium]|nr:hypothetical protein [Pseudonocardiales bacterium]
MPDMQPGAPARAHPCPTKWELYLRYALPSAVVAPPLQTISRALDVLLSFSESRTDWGVLELAEHTGWSKSSTQRVLAALASQGFLWVDPSTRRYGLGSAIWRLSSLWERTGGLARIADDCLRGLTADTGLSASLSARDGAFTRCVSEVVGPLGPVRSVPLVGEVIPAHAGATSRACFAFVDAEVRRRTLYGRPLGTYSPRTQIDTERLEELFAQTATDGYAITHGEWDAGTRTAAAPVLVGRLIAGSVSVTARPADPELDLEPFVPRLLLAAAELSDLLASRSAPPRRDWRRGRARAGG